MHCERKFQISNEKSQTRRLTDSRTNLKFEIRNLKFLAILMFAAFPLFANDLSLDRHSARAGEAITITLSLEGSFATIDDVDIPVRNLTVSPEPSRSSEFSWINGTVIRRKVFRFTARAV